MAEARGSGATIQAVLAVAEATQEAVTTVQDQLSRQGDKIAQTREDAAAINAKLATLEKTVTELYRAVHQGNGVPSILMRLAAIESVTAETAKRCDTFKARGDREKIEIMKSRVAIWCAAIAALASVAAAVVTARLSQGS